VSPKRSELLIISFLYWALRRILELAVLLFRCEEAKEVEILGLRRELAIVRSQLGRPQPSTTDRALLAARASTGWAAAWSRCPNRA
jgi:putative transposase